MDKNKIVRDILESIAKRMEMDSVRCFNPAQDMVVDGASILGDPKGWYIGLGPIISEQAMYNRYQKQILDAKMRGLEAYLKLNDMEEKKTKKMTKAEAFEYLKGTKVLCKDYDKMEAVQDFVKSLGFHWADYSEDPMFTSILFLGEDERLTFSVSLKRFEDHKYEEISADDILSIEIVEGTPKFSYEKVVELAKPLMEYLNDTGCTEQIGVSYDHIVAQPMATFLHGEMKGC